MLSRKMELQTCQLCRELHNSAMQAIVNVDYKIAKVEPPLDWVSKTLTNCA